MQNNSKGGKMLVVGSVTYAMKSRDLLFAGGIRSYVERTKRSGEFGCGYGVRVPGDYVTAGEILRKAGIRVLAVLEL